jgi:predicted adenylyl cyclase CyaB
MKKKHEVEYRALIDTKTFASLLALGKKKFKDSFQDALTIEDSYFCPSHVTKFSEVEMNDIGSYSLRLRREVMDGQVITTLNTKIIRNTGDHNAWLEHETGLSSYEECEKILRAIGFKSFFSFKKTRYSFCDRDIHICLEDIENFQPAIELEIMTTEDNVAEAKKELLNYMTKNGIEKEAIVKKSITRF